MKLRYETDEHAREMTVVACRYRDGDSGVEEALRRWTLETATQFVANRQVAKEIRHEARVDPSEVPARVTGELLKYLRAERIRWDPAAKPWPDYIRGRANKRLKDCYPRKRRVANRAQDSRLDGDGSGNLGGLPTEAQFIPLELVHETAAVERGPEAVLAEAETENERVDLLHAAMNYIAQWPGPDRDLVVRRYLGRMPLSFVQEGLGVTTDEIMATLAGRDQWSWKDASAARGEPLSSLKSRLHYSLRAIGHELRGDNGSFRSPLPARALPPDAPAQFH